MVWAATYDSFGNCQVDTEEIANNLRLPGQYYDAETGLHYNWHRYYDPQTGRYLQTDPFGDGLNLYAYCFNNPHTWFDPAGLCAVKDVSNWAKEACDWIVEREKRLQAEQDREWYEFCAEEGLLDEDGNPPPKEEVFKIGEIPIGPGAFKGIIRALKNLPKTLRNLGAVGKNIFKATKTGARLSDNIAKTFAGGKYHIKVLRQDVVAYRYSGGTSGLKGSFLTTQQTVRQISSPADAQRLLNLPPGATAEQLNAFVIPKGTTIYYGRVAGGGETATQIFIQDASVLRAVP